jgi:hypothetical protein
VFSYLDECLDRDRKKEGKKERKKTERKERKKGQISDTYALCKH